MVYTVFAPLDKMLIYKIRRFKEVFLYRAIIILTTKILTMEKQEIKITKDVMGGGAVQYTLKVII